MNDRRNDSPDESHVEYRHGNYVTHHDWDSDQGMTTTIAEVLEAVPEVRLREGDPLYEVIDVDALETLCYRGDTTLDVEVRFTYQGCSILVSADGTVSVQPSTARQPYRSDGTVGH